MSTSSEETIQLEPPVEKSSHVDSQPNTSGQDEGNNYCKVSVAYSSEMEDELQLEEGDIIKISSKRADGWWMGVLRGKEGLFPSNFVVPIEKTTPEQLSSYRGDGEKYCKVLHAYSPAMSDELQLEKDDIIEVLCKYDDGWWKGRLRDKEGIFPSHFVAPLQTPTSEQYSESNPQSPTPPGQLSNEEEKQYCRVLHAYSPDMSDELRLEENDIIEIILKSADGWWKGRLREKVGFFPANFVTTTSIHSPSSSGTSSTPQAAAMLTQCQVVIPFAGNNYDELTLEEGDVITVVSKDIPESTEGGLWWKGVLRGTTGLFPRIFVKELTARTSENEEDEPRNVSENEASDWPAQEEPPSFKETEPPSTGASEVPLDPPSVPEVSDESSKQEEIQLEEILEIVKVVVADDDRNKCGICMDCDINTAFFPCGHITCCADCAAKCPELCPLCRTKIERTERVYLPG